MLIEIFGNEEFFEAGDYKKIFYDCDKDSIPELVKIFKPKKVTMLESAVGNEEVAFYKPKIKYLTDSDFYKYEKEYSDWLKKIKVAKTKKKINN